MKHWIFDLDGTLVDSHQVYFDSLAAVLKKFSADLSATDKSEVLRISGSERGHFFAKKLGAHNVPEAQRLLADRLEEDSRKLLIFDGIEDLLTGLETKNVKLAVWSARDLASLEEVLNSTGLAKYFSFAVGNTCISKCKPDPEGLLRISKHFNCPTSAMVMVGDHDNDINAAKACGAKAIRAFWHSPQAQPLCVISDLQFSRVQSLSDWAMANC